LEIARNVMEPAPLVSPELDLKELAQRLLAADVDGVCVVDDAGRLVGVVTGMDLVFREKKVHPPAMIAVLDLVLTFGGRRTERELEKMAAVNVGALMTREVVTAVPETPVDELATRMVEQHLSMIPVVEGGVPIGVVTRRGMVRATLRHLLGT
jgi:CBS domain-containing protein